MAKITQFKGHSRLLETTCFDTEPGHVSLWLCSNTACLWTWHTEVSQGPMSSNHGGVAAGTAWETILVRDDVSQSVETPHTPRALAPMITPRTQRLVSGQWSSVTASLFLLCRIAPPRIPL